MLLPHLTLTDNIILCFCVWCHSTFVHGEQHQLKKLFRGINKELLWHWFLHYLWERLIGNQPNNNQESKMHGRGLLVFTYNFPCQLKFIIFQWIFLVKYFIYTFCLFLNSIYTFFFFVFENQPTFCSEG